jgi:hypothetical protein
VKNILIFAVLLALLVCQDKYLAERFKWLSVKKWPFRIIITVYNFIVLQICWSYLAKELHFEIVTKGNVTILFLIAFVIALLITKKEEHFYT